MGAYPGEGGSWARTPWREEGWRWGSTRGGVQRGSWPEKGGGVGRGRGPAAGWAGPVAPSKEAGVCESVVRGQKKEDEFG